MDYYRYLDMIWKLSNWYFSKDALPYWCIFVLDCLIVLGADVLVYALNNGTLSFFAELCTTDRGFLLLFVVLCCELSDVSYVFGGDSLFFVYRFAADGFCHDYGLADDYRRQVSAE